MAKNYLKASAKAVRVFAGPLAAPFEAVLSLYEDEQTEKREAKLDEMILEGQNLNREVLAEIFEARSEIKELREQFILGIEICFSLLAKDRKLFSSPDLEENLPFLIEQYKERFEASGLITDEVLADELYKCYEKDTRLLLAHISADFPLEELPSYEALAVIISDFLTKCSGQGLNQQAKIFNALSRKNPGSKPLKVKSLMLQEQVISQIDKYPRVEWLLELNCHFDEIDDKKIESIINYCREISGDISLTLKRKERGSIKLTFEGSQEGMEKIKALFDSGELTAILEIPIKNISSLTEQKLPSPLITTQKILFLSANPKGTSQVRLDEEIREIKEGLLRSKKREKFVIEIGQAVRYREIRRAILDFEPNIVHFSGHGAGEEGLAFEDETGQPKLVETKALAGLFELFAGHIECVVLNACYSEVQAKAIAEHIPSVVGMNKAIGDRAAIEFAVGFYDALGAGKTVEFAYKLGCNSIEIAGIPENLTPQLLRKNP